MYLSTERLALANQAVRETFEQASVAWQAIPHWDTRDPSQTQVPNDNLTNPAFLSLTPPVVQPFTVTIAEAIAPKPQALLANVIANTVLLAKKVDDAVFPALRAGAHEEHITTPAAADILNGLIDARVWVEQGGYRAPSCLVTDTAGLKILTALTPAGVPGTELLLSPANINSLYRADDVEQPHVDVVGYLLGRRQRIAHSGAADASPGEEALDLAVSIPPSLEVVGETPANAIQLIVRIGYALRIKDINGYTAIRTP
ncbi:MAG: hypothetical protein ACXVYI_01110 [Mycobacterium sp.]